MLYLNEDKKELLWNKLHPIFYDFINYVFLISELYELFNDFNLLHKSIMFEIFPDLVHDKIYQ